MSAMTDLITAAATNTTNLNSAILSVQNQATALTAQLAQLAAMAAADSTLILQTELAGVQKMVADDIAAVQAAAQTLGATGPTGP